MKVGPISGDLVVELALLAATIGAGVWAFKKAGAALPSVPDALNAINPLNSNNVFITGADTAISDATGRPETIGGWAYSITHPDPVAAGANQPNPADVTGNGTGTGSFLDQFNQANSY